MKMSKKENVGGQAVIEGVMMRGYKKVAIAVRCPDDSIELDVGPTNSITDKYPILSKPFIRGVVVLVESLVDGMKSLTYSAQVSGEDEEQLTDLQMGLTMMVSVVFAIGLFIILPTWSIHLLSIWTENTIVLNLAEGILRLGIFLVYIYAISRMEDIKRIFQYHGAEHKIIYTYEAGKRLTPENARPFGRLHPRCGTNFLTIVMLIGIFIFAFLGWPNLLVRISSRIVLMPVIAGISYEIIRFASKHMDKKWVRNAILPGLLLQKITTSEPDDSMLEVAAESLYAVLPEDQKEQYVPDTVLARRKAKEEAEALKEAAAAIVENDNNSETQTLEKTPVAKDEKIKPVANETLLVSGEL